MAIDTGAPMILVTFLLAVAAFWLGACPFSVWVGHRFLNREIRSYGDGNPGAVNVFRAGNIRTGLLAVVLDVAKGVPFVFLSHAVLDLPVILIVLVGLAAISGHAFSPLLGWRGGKAIAVTFGVMVALPQHEILFAFIALLLLGLLFLDEHAWVVVFGATGTLAYLALTRGASWETFFIGVVLALFVYKHFPELHAMPAVRVRLIHWFQSRR